MAELDAADLDAAELDAAGFDMAGFDPAGGDWAGPPAEDDLWAGTDAVRDDDRQGRRRTESTRKRPARSETADRSGDLADLRAALAGLRPGGDLSAVREGLELSRKQGVKPGGESGRRQGVEPGRVSGGRQGVEPGGESDRRQGVEPGRESGRPQGRESGRRQGVEPGLGQGRGRERGGRQARPDEPPRSEAEVAREICIRQLAVRPRTRAELAKALAKREISGEVIAEVLDRYDEVGMIDDAAFARAWVSSRHHGRGLARRALANELRQRGVDAEVAGAALESVDDEAEAATARELVDRKLRTVRGEPDAVFRKLVGMLARKGYSAGVAIRAVKDALAARDAEAAEFAEQIDADAMADE